MTVWFRCVFLCSIVLNGLSVAAAFDSCDFFVDLSTFDAAVNN